jgi:hypothetical protein
MILAEFGTGQVLWSMLWFTLFFFWIWTVIMVFSDIFRSDDLSGWGKALWSLFVIFLPFLGVFVYLIARGKTMGKREIARAQQKQAAFDAYVRDTATGGSGPSKAEELGRLAELRSRGDISEEEFRRAKDLVLNDDRPSTPSDTGAGTPRQ